MLGFLEQWIIPYLVDYGLLAIFLLSALESACIPIPSEIVVPYGGVLAQQGHVTLWAVVVVATLGNLAGSTVAYLVGRYGGREAVIRYGRWVLISHHHLEAADRWFERHGEATVFLTRMMPGVRTFISVPAGVTRMPFGRFALYSALGALPWNLALAYLGFLFADNWDGLQQLFHRYDRIFYILLVLAVLTLVGWKWRGSRRSRAADGPVG